MYVCKCLDIERKNRETESIGSVINIYKHIYKYICVYIQIYMCIYTCMCIYLWFINKYFIDIYIYNIYDIYKNIHLYIYL